MVLLRENCMFLPLSVSMIPGLSGATARGKKSKTLIPNGVCGVRSLSFSWVVRQKRFLASLRMTKENAFFRKVYNLRSSPRRDSFLLR